MDFEDPQIQDLLKNRKKIGRFLFPGTEGFEVGVRLLTEKQVDVAYLKAQVHLSGLCKKAGLEFAELLLAQPELMDQESQRQLLLVALVTPESDPERPDPFFKKEDHIRELDNVMMRLLWSEYQGWVDQNTLREQISEEQMREIVEALKKDPDSLAGLARWNADSLANLLRFMAAQWPS